MANDNAPLQLMSDEKWQAQLDAEAAAREATAQAEKNSAKRPGHDVLRLVPDSPDEATASPPRPAEKQPATHRPGISDAIRAFFKKTPDVVVTEQPVTLMVQDKPVNCVEFTLPETTGADKANRNASLKEMGFDDEIIARGMDKSFAQDRWIIKVPVRTMEALAAKLSPAAHGRS